MTDTPPPKPSKPPSLAGRILWALVAFAAVATLAIAAFLRFGPGLPAPPRGGSANP